MYEQSFGKHIFEEVTIMNKVKERKTKETIRRSVKIFGISYNLDITYKYIKAPKLTVENKIIKIVLPNKYKKINNETILELLIEKMYEAIAEKELDTIMEKVRTTLKFAPENYEIARIDKTLGKCLSDKIIINPDIVMYKKETIEYIIFHEFCHLKFKKHSKKFYDMIASYMPNYECYAYEVVGMQY